MLFTLLPANKHRFESDHRVERSEPRLRQFSHNSQGRTRLLPASSPSIPKDDPVPSMRKAGEYQHFLSFFSLFFFISSFSELFPLSQLCRLTSIHTLS